MGFEHAILDIILRMEQKRLQHLQQQEAAKKVRKEGEDKVKNLICIVNYAGREIIDKRRKYKALSG